ncbi:hypothetical protein [Aeromicrobium sp. UC242_57]|uniref:hypothetical protein n=1 Tax=Aeromicrobium sp. UC242_57 TaxID=3374624 RepID=UPI0037A1AE33
MSTSDPIVAVYVDLVDKTLPRELRLGPFTVARRTYAVVRIETESGLTGYAYSQTRGAPVAEIIERLLTPVLVGRDSASIKARWQQCFGSTWGWGAPVW